MSCKEQNNCLTCVLWKIFKMKFRVTILVDEDTTFSFPPIVERVTPSSVTHFLHPSLTPPFILIADVHEETLHQRDATVTFRATQVIKEKLSLEQCVELPNSTFGPNYNDQSWYPHGTNRQSKFLHIVHANCSKCWTNRETYVLVFRRWPLEFQWFNSHTMGVRVSSNIWK